MAEQRVTDELRDELTAYLDGEMSEQEAKQFEQKLQREPDLRAEAESMKRAWELLDFLPQPEPSPTFTSKTLDKITVLRPSPSVAATLPAASRFESEAVPGPAKRTRPKWLPYLGWTAAALVLFVAGFIISGPMLRKGTKSNEPRNPQLVEDEMARDLRILHQLPQYEVGEDIAFLEALDAPELFGDGGSGR